MEINYQRNTLMIVLNENFIDGTSISRMSLYELDKTTLAYIDHWWSELSDYTAGRVKKMSFEGDTIFYLTY